MPWKTNIGWLIFWNFLYEKSSFYYQKNAKEKPEKYADLRKKIAEIFEKNKKGSFLISRILPIIFTPFRFLFSFRVIISLFYSLVECWVGLAVTEKK